MTPNEVMVRVEKIRASAGDRDIAHGMEDELYRDVLTAISKGAADAVSLASLALETKSIEFTRWTS